MAKLHNMDGLKKALTGKHNTQVRGFVRGVKKGGLHLQRKSQEEVPVDTANLKNSAFTRAEETTSQIIVTVGYTAEYAVYVHEIPPTPYTTASGKARPGAQHAPGKKWKYLEGPARTERGEILNIISVETTSG